MNINWAKLLRLLPGGKIINIVLFIIAVIIFVLIFTKYIPSTGVAEVIAEDIIQEECGLDIKPVK